MCKLLVVVFVYYSACLYSVLCQNTSFNDVQVILVDMQMKETIIPRKSYPNLHRVIHDSELFALRIINENIPTLYNNSVTDVKKTNRIELDSNKIAVIEPGAFANLTSVFISLKHNMISEISENTFNGQAGIKGLDFEFNRISKIHEKAFCEMKDLSTLILSHNQISFWSIGYFDKSPIANIFISSNKLTEIPLEAFHYWKEFNKNNSMEFVDFTNNNISIIKNRSFADVKSVRYLYLGHNQLQNITLEMFNDVDYIGYLSLRNNKINCLPQNFTHLMTIVKMLDMDGNPMRCDCIKIAKQWSDTNGGAIILPGGTCI